jgi:hypothetical protein
MRIEYNGSAARKLAQGLETLAWLTAKVEREAVPIAKHLAPRRTGALADSITAMPGEGTVKLIATDFKAAWQEKGTSKMPAHPFLEPATRTVFPTARIISGGGEG